MVISEPFDIGAPYYHRSCHVGLYQPMLGRFLLTVNNIQHAQDIVLIASGRYPLFMVNLVTADNYCENLIDNLCCENWALLDRQMAPTQMENYANFVVNAEHLLERHDELDVSEEQQYLQLCWHYLKLLDQFTANNIFGWRVKQFMSDIFDFEENHHDTLVQNLRKQVITELYLCKDIDSVRASIENIITKAKKDHDLVF